METTNESRYLGNAATGVSFPIICNYVRSRTIKKTIISKNIL